MSYCEGCLCVCKHDPAVFIDNELLFFDDESDSEDEEEAEENEDPWGDSPPGLGAGKSNKISAVRASSIGCVEEELKRRLLWHVMKLPYADDDIYNDNEEEEAGDADERDLEDVSLDVRSIRVDFVEVAHDMISVGYSKNNQVENVLLEVKSLKFAHNKEYSDCLRAGVRALFDAVGKAVLPSPLVPGVDYHVKLVQGIKSLCAVKGAWGYKLLSGLIVSASDQLCVLECIEDYCCSSPPFYSTFRFALQLLHGCELLQEESVLRWVELRRELTDPADKRYVLFHEPVVQDFVQWISTEETEDEEEEEEDQ